MTERYAVTIADRVQRWCPMCAKVVFVYVVIENESVEKTCCCTCSRILKTTAVGA